MSFGKTKDRRRQAAQKHLRDVHKCPRCGKEVRGNGYGNHKKACKARSV